MKKILASEIIPVILAGGSGTRLWPISRENEPKPFIKFFNKKSLFQEAIIRARIHNKINIIVVLRQELFFIAKEQAEELNIAVTFLLEPDSRNTAAAILMAAKFIDEKFGNDRHMLIMPSDHFIDKVNLYKNAIKSSIAISYKNDIVVFGINPTFPHTGFGYIEVEQTGNRIISFKEKPSYKCAAQYLQTGNYYWNSGIFLAKVGTILSAYNKYTERLYQSLMTIDFFSTLKNVYSIPYLKYKKIPLISFDCAILEKAKNISCIKANFYWDDIGDWKAFSESKFFRNEGIKTNKKNKNLIDNNSISTFYLGTNQHKVVGLIDVKNLIIIDSDDALLIADKDSAQKVKDLTSNIKKKLNNEVLLDHSIVKRPWGSFKVLVASESYKVKKIILNPYSSISLQSHNKRNEHWIVVEGKAKVVNGDKVLTLYKNESTYVKAKTKHRLSNPFAKKLIIIEVQSGNYLGEDDIMRFSDDYMRPVM
jgi:mannose-1-phosphate guanylyltransferase/mannose-6-phosphate isomerase